MQLFQRLEFQGLLSTLTLLHSRAIFVSPLTLSIHICTKQIPLFTSFLPLAGTTTTHSCHQQDNQLNNNELAHVGFLWAC
eukprot:3185203-Rhodomonas_salina.1